jgi:hypothetical protein
MPISQNEARQNLEVLLTKYANLAPETRPQLSEADVVHQFIDPLLEKVLGWPIGDNERCKYELSTEVGRPDITLIPEKGGVIFLEAKRFGKIDELNPNRFSLASKTLTPSQMALAGMAVDRTAEEQQAINYAFANGGTWAILCNFERLRLFNARRDWLVLSFDDPYDFRRDFDLLWQLAYANILDGSLDALSNQRYARDIDSQYLDFINQWRERLAQDIIARRAHNPWVELPDGNLNLPLLRAVVQRYLDRLVISRFAEDHLVIPPSTLRGFYELRRSNPYTHTMDEYLDRFFRRFDEDHNSALFAPDLVDQASLGDDVLMPLVDKLYEVRYRSMPADILGNTYEQYLGKTLVQLNGEVKTADNLETRKKQGSYYTPQVIVRYIVDNSLGRYLYGTENGRPDGTPIPGETRKTASDLRDLRVLDSACGSGSFLIYAYQVLVEFYESELERLRADYDDSVKQLAAKFEQITLDDRVAAQRLENELARLRDYPRLILESHLYGVDLDPQAAEIAVVNLMMRAMEGRHGEKRLPLLLNQNVKVGNSLIGLRPDDPRLSEYASAITHIRKLRADLVATPHGAEHDRIILELQEATARVKAVLDEALRGNFTLAPRPPLPQGEGEKDALDEGEHPHPPAFSVGSGLKPTVQEGEQEPESALERVRPFHWGIEFPEVFYDEEGRLKENAGFTIIVGNPPWEIVKPDLREYYAQYDPRIESQLNRAQAEARIAELQLEDPRRAEEFERQNQVTERTSAYVRQSPDYSRQGRGDTATHKLFLERSYAHLLAREGRIGYVVPSGIYTDLGTKDLREMLLNEGNIQYIYSFSNERGFFSGVHHDFKFTLIGAQKGQQSEGFWAAFRFNPRVAVTPDELPAFLANSDNLIFIRRDAIFRFSPDSLSLMEFKNQHDVNITEKLYGEHPLIGDKLVNSWNIRLNREFDMTNDRKLFNTNSGMIPVYNGRMIHQYDAHYAPHEFWISEEKVSAISTETWNQIQHYRLGFRRISNTTNERTLIAAIVPPNTICDTVAIAENNETNSHVQLLYLCALFNSFCLDYVIREKVAKTINMFYVYQLPMPRLTSGNPYFEAIVARAARLVCVRAEFAGLWREVTGATPPPPPPPQTWRGGERCAR